MPGGSKWLVTIETAVNRIIDIEKANELSDKLLSKVGFRSYSGQNELDWSDYQAQDN